MKNRKLSIIIGGIVVLILLIGIGIFAVLPTITSASKGQTTPTPSVQATTTPAHKANVLNKTLKQYAPEIKNQIAQGLHMTPAQLTTQLQAGKTLTDVATAQHVSSTQLQTVIDNAIHSALQPAIDDGTLTKTQVDKLAKRYENNPQLLDHLLGGKATPKTTSTPTQQTTPTPGQ